MKIIRFLIIVALCIGQSSVIAQEKIEATVGNIESRSLTARIDAFNHVNSIVERYKSTMRGVKNDTVPEAYYDQAKSMRQQAIAQIEKLDQLNSDVAKLKPSVHSSYLLTKRLDVVRREISCSEFALKVSLDHVHELEKAIVLANRVLSDCKVINDNSLK